MPATCPRVIAVIPALNEEASLPLVLRDLPSDLVYDVIVVDNGSSDETATLARQAGAVVIPEEERGYGAACQTGIARALEMEAEVILFLDADYSDHPEEAVLILEPIFAGEADLVIGSRTRGNREPGAMPPQAIFGNWLATRLIRLLWGVGYTDLGPFRAVTRQALEQIGMTDRDFGWTVEMQARAAQLGIRSTEVPVSYRRRRGVSKISGTISGSVRAGVKILYTIARLRFRPPS